MGHVIAIKKLVLLRVFERGHEYYVCHEFQLLMLTVKKNYLHLALFRMWI